MNETKWETNPFKVFSPPNAQYFVLGSFAAKDGKDGHDYNWYYSNGRNQFWPILEEVYKTELRSKKAQQALFTKHKIAIADIIYQCERKGNSSLDMNLSKFIYNHKSIAKVLKENKIKRILFTSRFVEKEFKKNFKDLIEKYPKTELATLPSPSPRYAAMKFTDKVKIYKSLLPS